MLAVSLLLALLPAADAESLSRFEAEEPHMGSLVRITVYAADEQQAKRGIEAAFAEFTSLNQIMSDYLDRSELNHLSDASPTGTPIKVSKPLFDVLNESQSWSQKTGGAFDITVGPLVRQWRRARRRKEMPAPEKQQAARNSVGWKHLKLHAESQSVSLSAADMKLDLGGIAKGFAADAALRALERAGLKRALVNASGDIVAGDPPPGETGWRIGVAPLKPAGNPSRFLSIAHAAIATSGDAFQFVVIDGKRYSHIIDPRSGQPVTGRSSVTIVAKSGSAADAAASAVSVMGPIAGMKFIDQAADLEGLIVAAEGENIAVRTSKGLRTHPKTGLGSSSTNIKRSFQRGS